MKGGMTLYPDQKDWCRKVVRAFEKGDPEANQPPFGRVMGVAATGAGKTIMAAALTEYVLLRWRRPKHRPRVLFLADTDELVHQAGEKIYSFTGRPTDREKASERASLESEIVVGSMQTLQNPERRERYPAGHFDLVIIDEAHQSMADTWIATMEHFENQGSRILGITATPERGDERDLWSWWQHQAAEIGLFDLIEKGRLAPIRVKTLPLELDCREARERAGGLDDQDVQHAIEPAFEAIIEAWEQHGEDRKTLWFLPGIQASQRFVELLSERGHAAKHIDGKQPNRRAILEGYAENRFRHLANSNLLIKGYDCPDISCVVNLSPGKSRVAYQQKVGRGTRVADGKQDLLLLDFLWQFDALGIARPVDLVARSTDEATRMQHQLDQQARQSDRPDQQEALDLHDQRDLADNVLVQSLIAQLRANTTRRTRTYDAGAAAALLNAPELMVYEPQADWERMKPTDRQKEILKHKGISTRNIKTRGHASAIIDVLIQRQHQGKATLKQAARLTAAGIDEAGELSFSEASAEMQRIIEESQTSES